jgi:hypothetical protein
MTTSRFAGLKRPAATPPAPAAAAPAATPEPVAPSPRKAPAREGKKAVVGYFSPAVSRALGRLAVDEDTSIQALLGEAIDDLMRKRGGHPFGER